MKHLSRVFLAMVLCPFAFGQGTYTAASCNYSDLEACIAGIGSTCTLPGGGTGSHTVQDGDVISVPAGSCTWGNGVSGTNQQITWSGVGISLIGAGYANTTIIDNNDNTGSGGNPGTLFVARPTCSPSCNQLTRISGMTIEPQSGATSIKNGPIMVIGTCTTSTPYCPNLRIDNNYFPSGWSSAGISDNTVAYESNMFGVADHNIVGTSGLTGLTGIGVALVNVNHPSWQGSGLYGDASWASADTFGTNQAFYVENNTFNYAFGTDADGSDQLQDVGGGRYVCRFNTFNGVTTAGACTDHGTETAGRPRGGRQMESYGNALTCVGSSGCAGAFGMRSGINRIFGNSFGVSSGGFFTNWANLATERNYRPTVWGFCGGVGPWDVNDGESTAWSGAISSVTGTPTSMPITITVAGTPWTAGAYNFSSSSPGGTYYTVYDSTIGTVAGIASNTANTLTLAWVMGNGGAQRFFNFSGAVNFGVLIPFASVTYSAGTATVTLGGSLAYLSSGLYVMVTGFNGNGWNTVAQVEGPITTTCNGSCSAGNTFTFPVSGVTGNPTTNGTISEGGDSITIFGTTLYQAGTDTGTTGSTTLADSSKTWTAGQWTVGGSNTYPYAVLDVTQGYIWEVGTMAVGPPPTLSPYTVPNSPSWTWTNGDAYAILRSSQCFDQPTASGGQNWAPNSYAPPPQAATTEALDPDYFFDNVLASGSNPSHGMFNSDSQHQLGSTVLVSNTNPAFYAATIIAGSIQGAQTSSSSPFSGTSGVGWGTLANRPSTCTQGTGYWATDQGNWNLSTQTLADGTSQGELFICGASGWPGTASYVPYTYPHPLEAQPAGVTLQNATLSGVVIIQ